MNSTASPTAWRRWLALKLRLLRENAGLTQKEVARVLRCNVSKVSYIENAQRPVVPRDLNEILLPLYEVPEDEWDRYLKAARDAREPQWWEAYTEDGALVAAGDLYVGLEQGASRLRTHQSQHVPGLLQTPDYTRAIMERLAKWDDAKTDAAIELRQRRQDVLTRKQNPLKLWAVLDEAVVRRLVGSQETMRAQVDHLVHMAQRPNITLQVLPFSIGAHHGMTGSFIMIDFAWPDAIDLGVVFFESVLRGGVFVEERNLVEAYISQWEELSAIGERPEATVEWLKQVSKEYT